MREGGTYVSLQLPESDRTELPIAIQYEESLSANWKKLEILIFKPQEKDSNEILKNKSEIESLNALSLAKYCY